MEGNPRLFLCLIGGHGALTPLIRHSAVDQGRGGGYNRVVTPPPGIMSNRGILWLSLTEQQSPVGLVHDNPARHFHVTLQFGVEHTPEMEELLGKEVEAFAVADCFNERVQALRVSLPDDVASLCSNEHPHMTISSADGVKPVESNTMLAGDHNSSEVSIPLTLRYEFFHFDRT